MITPRSTLLAGWFQGDERDVTVFSPVVSSSMPAGLLRHAGNPNLVNVSLTRARSKLVIVGDWTASAADGGVLADLANFVSDTGDVLRSDD